MEWKNNNVKNAQIVGSPVNFRKQSSQLSPFRTQNSGGVSNSKQQRQQYSPPTFALHLPTHNDPYYKTPGSHHSQHVSSGHSPTKKPRPSTAIALSSSAMSNSLLCIHHQQDHDQLRQQSSSSSSAFERHHQHSAASNNIAPLPQAAFAYEAHVSSGSSTSTVPDALNAVHQTMRCAGCGAIAEMCMKCFSHFRKKDGTAYKAQIVRSVEILFEKATARAFTKMSDVILQWLFGIWKYITQQHKHRRNQALRITAQNRLKRRLTTWRMFMYERRIVGAMLYAENQQLMTTEKNREISQLHGDMFVISNASRVKEQLHEDDLARLQHECQSLQQALQAKNLELIAIRKELRDAKSQIAALEKQVVNPKELEQLKVESVDYKKIAFQLANTVCYNLETQLEVLATSDCRHNLNNVFTKDLLQAIDKPENQALYNPFVEINAAVAGTKSTSNSSETVGNSSNTSASVTGNAGASLFSSHDASADRADKILMQWVNSLVQRQPPEWIAAPRMTNFHSSLSDGKVLVVVTKLLHAAMSKVRPIRLAHNTAASKLEAASVLRENGEDLTEIAMERYVNHIRQEENVEKRIELMINTIGQAMWLPVGLVNSKDVLAGDAELNFAILSYLFCTFTPNIEESYYTLCNDLKLQLSSVKAKWRDLREGTGLTSNESGGGITLSSKMKLALAHLIELKKRIDLEDQKLREDHLLWCKCMRIVMRKCFLSYARFMRGKPGVLAKLDSESDQNELFTKIPGQKILDLELPFEDFAWEIKLLQSFLLTIYRDLGRIYRGYATRNGIINEAINVGDFIELLTECRVIEKNMTVTDIHAIIKKMDPKLTSVSPHRALPPTEFLEALIRIARRKYSPENHRVTVSEAFCLFMDNFILPFAFRADADLFRKQIDDIKIRRLIIQYSDDLKNLYARYAVAPNPRLQQHHPTSQTSKRPRMTAFTFSQCLLDKRIQGTQLTRDNVLAIVQKVTQSTSKKDHEVSSRISTSSAASDPFSISIPTNETEELTYEEFEEAMIAIACHMFPDPYCSFERRVEKFFSFYIREDR